jgi:glycosyltransferase involved in cell wall biosynthesis
MTCRGDDGQATVDSPHPTDLGIVRRAGGISKRAGKDSSAVVHRRKALVTTMISFIVPAHNEELLIGRTLESLHAAALSVDEPYEIVVTDDCSTDQTARIAMAHGARVVSVTYRQISATRNAGAREAVGNWLFFVDADTIASPAAVQEALGAMRRGAVGGGCVFQFDGRLPLWARSIYRLAVPLMRLWKLVGGCFLFCTRDAFRDVGGFPERYYAAEEVFFTAALKRRGRFVVPRPCVTTSGRKLRTLSALELARALLRTALGGKAALRQREGLAIWYGPRRTDPDAMSPSCDPGSCADGRQEFC